MLYNLWAFVQDPANRVVLGWIGGGIAAVAVAAWAVIQFFAKKDGVRADRGSVAAGRDIANSPIKIDPSRSEKR
jgi:hypothetical protein